MSTTLLSQFPCQRSQFQLPESCHYLNGAYMAPLSNVVWQAGRDALERQFNPVQLPAEAYFAYPNRVRSAFARLVSAESSSRIALLPSVSYAMTTVANNIPVQSGANVVVIGSEFPSAVLPWRRYARTYGLELRTVDPEEGDSAGRSRSQCWNERLHDAIDTRTTVVVLSCVHWSDGTRFDVVRLAQRARDVGAVVVIDGTQSLGALPFDVQKVQPDMLVSAGYKWLMGGYGLSVAYFGPRFDDGQPIDDVWTSQQESDHFAALAMYRDSYRNTAERYDGGQRASFILAPMLATAVEQLLDWGVANIQDYCATLTAPWIDRLLELGAWVEPAEGRAAHLFGVGLPGDVDLEQVARSLRDRGIHVSVRGRLLRVSPNVYNTEDDMAALYDALCGFGGMRKCYAVDYAR